MSQRPDGAPAYSGAMTFLHSNAWRRLAALAAGAAVLLLAGCASGGAAPDGAAAGPSRGSVEVFGVIDASVSHVTNKSDRR